MNVRSCNSVFLAIAFLACPLPAVWAETVGSCPSDMPSETTVAEPCVEAAPTAGFLSDNFFTRFCHNVCRDIKRNNCWPEPFVYADREAVRAPFVRMVAKGWERQNTLGDHDFVPETGQLTLAGQSKVRSILLQGSPQHRTIYVHRSILPSETTARVDAVQQLAARTVRHGDLPEVLETDLPAPGWSANQVDAVERKYHSTMPTPRLPEKKDDSDSGM